MKIPSIIIKQYLSLVSDLNPIHNDIVPGQLICEIVFGELNVHWSEYNIKYLKTVGIADNLYFSFKEEGQIIVSEEIEGVKLVITKL